MRFWVTFANRPAVFLDARDFIEVHRKARRMGNLSTIETVSPPMMRDLGPHGEELKPGAIVWLENPEGNPDAHY